MIALQDMYGARPNLVFGFHGCRESVYDKVLYQGEQLRWSTNKYDWLGNGIYFWENSLQRASNWARSRYGEEGRVIGAILDLGHCLDLLDCASNDVLRFAYNLLKTRYEHSGQPLPVNRKSAKREDVLLRDLDCAVIECVHDANRASGMPGYDSVRGPFIEGSPVYPGSELREMTHIQICVVNPNCIKGYFRPVSADDEFVMP